MTTGAICWFRCGDRASASTELTLLELERYNGNDIQPEMRQWMKAITLPAKKSGSIESFQRTKAKPY
jgi:hypothetical protein